MATRATSAQFRDSRADREAIEDAIQSTNCGVRPLRLGKSRRHSQSSPTVEAVANLIAGFLVALLGQQIILPLFDIHVGLAANAVIAALFTLLSLIRFYVLRHVFDHIVRQRCERQRQQRERLARRFVR